MKKISLYLVGCIAFSTSYSESAGSDSKQADSLSWGLVSEDSVFLDIDPVIWSRPSEEHSSRLLYYKRPAPELGLNAMEMVSWETGVRLFGRTEKGEIDPLPPNYRALLKTQSVDSGVAKTIYDLNGNLLSTITFDSPDVQDQYYFDNGEYIGVDYKRGFFHVVIPVRGIYRKIPALDSPNALDYDTGISSRHVLYDPIHRDMCIGLAARSRYSVKAKGFVYISLLIDQEANVLWRREKPGLAYAIQSPNGQYVALLCGNNFQGEVEIIQRDGATVSTIQTAFSVSWDAFSEDGQKIAFKDSQYGQVRVYDVSTGALLNTFSLSGLVELALSNRSNLLVALSDDAVRVYPLDDPSSRPLWEYVMGPIQRRDAKNYPGETHVSISHNGREITAYSNGWLRIFRMAEKK